MNTSSSDLLAISSSSSSPDEKAPAVFIKGVSDVSIVAESINKNEFGCFYNAAFEAIADINAELDEAVIDDVSAFANIVHSFFELTGIKNIIDLSQSNTENKELYSGFLNAYLMTNSKINPYIKKYYAAFDQFTKSFKEGSEQQTKPGLQQQPRLPATTQEQQVNQAEIVRENAEFKKTISELQCQLAEEKTKRIQAEQFLEKLKQSASGENTTHLELSKENILLKSKLAYYWGVLLEKHSLDMRAGNYINQLRADNSVLEDKLSSASSRLAKYDAALDEARAAREAEYAKVKARENKEAKIAKILEAQQKKIELVYKQYFGDNRALGNLAVGKEGGDIGKYLDINSNTLWKRIKNFFSRESAKREQFLLQIKSELLACISFNDFDKFKITCDGIKTILNKYAQQIKPSGSDAILLTLLKSMKDSVDAVNHENQVLEDASVIYFKLKKVLDEKGNGYLIQRKKDKAIEFRDNWFSFGKKSQGEQRQEYLKELSTELKKLEKFAGNQECDNQKAVVYDKIFQGFKHYESRGGDEFKKSLRSHLMFAYRSVNSPEMLDKLLAEHGAGQRLFPATA